MVLEQTHRIQGIKWKNEPSLCSLSLVFFYPLLNDSCDGILQLSNVTIIESNHFNCQIYLLKYTLSDIALFIVLLCGGKINGNFSLLSIRSLQIFEGRRLAAIILLLSGLNNSIPLPTPAWFLPSLKFLTMATNELKNNESCEQISVPTLLNSSDASNRHNCFLLGIFLLTHFSQFASLTPGMYSQSPFCIGLLCFNYPLSVDIPWALVFAFLSVQERTLSECIHTCASTLI